MSLDWEADKRWSDQFIPEIKSILGQHLIGEAPKEEDALRNTDLIVLSMAPMRIACRVRTPEFYRRHPNDVTIRSERHSGRRTELVKVVDDGFGDYMLYGHGTNLIDGSASLRAWVLLKLCEFRAYYVEERSRGWQPGILKSNGDGSSDFRCFPVYCLPSSCIVAWHNIPYLDRYRQAGGPPDEKAEHTHSQ